MTVAPERPADVRPVAGCPSRRVRRAPRTATRPPQLADGVQLLGEYAGTGYETPQYLARRPGGQLVQLSAAAAPGRGRVRRRARRSSRSPSGSARRTARRSPPTTCGCSSTSCGRSGCSPPPTARSPQVAGGRPAARPEAAPPAAVRRDRCSGSPRLVRPVFWPPLVLAVVAGLRRRRRLAVLRPRRRRRAAVDGRAARSSSCWSRRSSWCRPRCTSSATRRPARTAAPRPGGMGAGIYVVWPAFYTDVTEAYQLDRRGRLRTDLGGVYVNAMVVLATAGAYAVTGYEPLVLHLLPAAGPGAAAAAALPAPGRLLRRQRPRRRPRPVPPHRAGAALGHPVPPGRAGGRRAQAVGAPGRRRLGASSSSPCSPLNLGYFLLAAPRIVATSWDSAARFAGQIPSGGADGRVRRRAAGPAAAADRRHHLHPASASARRAAGGPGAGPPARRAPRWRRRRVRRRSPGCSRWPGGRTAGSRPYREGERGHASSSTSPSCAPSAPAARCCAPPHEAQERLPAGRAGRPRAVLSEPTAGRDLRRRGRRAPATARPAARRQPRTRQPGADGRHPVTRAEPAAPTPAPGDRRGDAATPTPTPATRSPTSRPPAPDPVGLTADVDGSPAPSPSTSARRPRPRRPDGRPTA